MADECNDIAKNRSMFDSRRREFLKPVGMIGVGAALNDLILHSYEHPVAAKTASENIQLQGEESVIAAQNTTKFDAGEGRIVHSFPPQQQMLT